MKISLSVTLAAEFLPFIPVVLISSLGNGVIVFLLMRQSGLRTSANLLIGNMAIADFIQCICFTVTGVGTGVQVSYPLGSFWCKYDTFLKYWFLNVSQLSLIALSVDRVRRIFRPFDHELSSRMIFITCSSIWIFSLGVTMPLIFLRSLHTREWADFEENWCQENDAHWAVWVTFSAVLVYLPAVTMLLCYNLILLQMRRLRQRHQQHDSLIASQQITILKMVYVYLMMTIICWMPQQYLTYGKLFFSRRYNWTSEQRKVYLVYNLFAAANAALNPIIYGIANQTFRKSVKKMLPKCGPQPDHESQQVVTDNQVPPFGSIQE